MGGVVSGPLVVVVVGEAEPYGRPEEGVGPCAQPEGEAGRDVWKVWWWYHSVHVKERLSCLGACRYVGMCHYMELDHSPPTHNEQKKKIKPMSYTMHRKRTSYC